MTEQEKNAICTKYPWVKAYEELAQALKREYEDKITDDQKSNGDYSKIVSKVVEAFREAGVDYPITEDKLIKWARKNRVTVSEDDAKTFVAQQIDPFTIFQFCNEDWKGKKREDLVKAILDKFDVQYPPTLTFNGIPIMPSLAPKIFHVSYDEKAKEETGYLWEMFVSLLKDDWAETFVANYKNVKDIDRWGDSYLKLFWVQPLKFLPLEKKSSAYLNFNSFADLDVKEVKELKKNEGKYCQKCIDISENRAKNWPFSNFVEFSDAAEVFANSAIGKALRLLDANHNIILHGAPGTGKTTIAKKIADGMGAAFEQVQFHPSYDYTDFVEGLRPIQKEDGTKGGDVGFKLEDGTFKSFCRKALENPRQNYVFIIDEINRGDISKIFGELFFSIDPGYRGIQGAVQTQYSNMEKEPNAFDTTIQEMANDLGKVADDEKKKVEAARKMCKKEDGEKYKIKASGHFFVPDNVYIIGTMNDIDRSVESMDFAFRRRFAWLEILPEDRVEMLYDELGNVAEKAKTRMTNLNKVICANPNLGPAYQIGPAYFLKVKDYDDKPWEDLWESHLEGLLRDYLRGTESDSKQEREKLKDLYKAYNGKAEGSDDDD